MNGQIAIYAADIRSKYYDRQENPMSYMDAVHVAAADMLDCDTLYTGDADFEAVEEVEVEVV